MLIHLTGYLLIFEDIYYYSDEIDEITTIFLNNLLLSKSTNYKLIKLHNGIKLAEYMRFNVNTHEFTNETSSVKLVVDESYSLIVERINKLADKSQPLSASRKVYKPVTDPNVVPMQEQYSSRATRIDTTDCRVEDTSLRVPHCVNNTCKVKPSFQKSIQSSVVNLDEKSQSKKREKWIPKPTTQIVPQPVKEIDNKEYTNHQFENDYISYHKLVASIDKGECEIDEINSDFRLKYEIFNLLEETNNEKPKFEDVKVMLSEMLQEFTNFVNDGVASSTNSSNNSFQNGSSIPEVRELFGDDPFLSRKS